MGKPLLTDEVIERANRGDVFEKDQHLGDLEETKVIRTNHYYDSVDLEDDYVQEVEKEPVFSKLSNRQKNVDRVYKSRRIENAKRSEFQRKLNKVLFIVVLLVILLIWAVFNL